MAKTSRRTRKSRANQNNRVVVRIERPEEAPPSSLAEYSYVVADLKRVALLAAVMFALLIALSFFIG
jgi:hypothetical protein